MTKRTLRERAREPIYYTPGTRYKQPVPRLYEKSVAASRRYFKPCRAEKIGEIGKALWEVRRGDYRVGWMIGFKAGYRSGKRAALQARLEAAERLCRVYFEIAAEICGEDEVRFLRDAALARPQEPGA